MKKAVIITVVVLVFLGGISFLGYNFIKEYKQDVENTKKILKNIDTEYTDFEKKIVDYNKNLTKLVELLKNSTYIDKIDDNKEEIVKLMNLVSEQLDGLTSYKNLNAYCGKKFSDGKTNRNCSSFSRTYEKSVNVYVDIVSIYNDVSKKYNELVEESKKMKPYESKYKDYIDYDGDGIYLGKDVATGKGVGND